MPKTTKLGQYAVAVGDAFDGINLYGPFEDGEEATIWAGDTIKESWNVVELQEPE